MTRREEWLRSPEVTATLSRLGVDAEYFGKETLSSWKLGQRPGHRDSEVITLDYCAVRASANLSFVSTAIASMSRPESRVFIRVSRRWFPQPIACDSLMTVPVMPHAVRRHMPSHQCRP